VFDDGACVCLVVCSNVRVQIVWTKYDRDRRSPIYYPLVICFEVMCLLVCGLPLCAGRQYVCVCAL